MVLLKKKVITSYDNLKAYSYLYLKNEHETLLFDCPSVLYGANFRPSTFESPQKKLRFRTPHLENVDRIFITSSESMGILFLKEDIEIYITLPTYEQILSNYNSFLGLQLTFDDEIKNENLENTVCLDEVDIDRLKRNIRLITYNEKIKLNDIIIECKPSGLFIGWCTFLYKTSSKKFHITNKVTNRKKYAIEYEPIESDFEINLNCINQSSTSIEEFNEKVLSVKAKPLIIACDIPTSGIDLMFHLLYVYKNASLKTSFFIKYDKFNEYFNNLCNHTEWLRKPIKTNIILSNFSIIEDIQEIKPPCIVLIDIHYVYELNSNKYDILTIGDIMKDSFFVNDKSKDCYDFMFLDVYHLSKHSYNLINDKTYSIDIEEKTTNVTLQNTLRDFDEEFFYLSGCMINTDKNTPNIISKSINNSDVSSFNNLFEKEVYFYHEGYYFFPRYGFKIFVEKDKTYKFIKY